MICPMAERRLGRWCLCCILASVQVVSIISLEHSGDADVPVPAHHETHHRERLGLLLAGNISKGVQAEREGQTRPAWSKGDGSPLRTVETPQPHGTFTTEAAQSDDDTKTIPQQQSSLAETIPGKSRQKAPGEKLDSTAVSNTVGAVFTESSTQANDTTNSALVDSQQPNSRSQSSENKTTSPQLPRPGDQTLAPQTLGEGARDTSGLPENTDNIDVTDRNYHEPLVNFTTSETPVEYPNTMDVHEVSRDIEDNQTLSSKDRLKGEADKGRKWGRNLPLLTVASTVRRPESTNIEASEETSASLPFAGTTELKSQSDTKPAMGSPLAADIHHTTSTPLGPRQTASFSTSKTRKSLFTIKARSSLSTFKARPFTPKTDTEEQLIDNRNKDETNSKSQKPVSSKEHESLIFRTSKPNAAPGHIVAGDNTIHTPNGHKPARMSHHLKPTAINDRGVASGVSDNQPVFKTTLAHFPRLTKHKTAKRKSTVKVRRSTRDPEESDSTLPSSRRRSNAAAELETLTPVPAPAPRNSEAIPLETRKRHVPNQGLDYIDYDCSHHKDDHTHHSIEWTADAMLLVSLSGDGEALNVTWEIMSGNNAASGGSSRQVRDTDSGTLRPDIIKSSAIGTKSSKQLVNGFVVSYRIPGEEEYDSSRLRANVRTFVLHQLHLDEDYIICVHAMSGQQRVHEECANWSKSMLQRKAVMGTLAGTLFFLPCLIALVMIIRKDRQMRAKHGSGLGTWRVTHPGLVRAFATCEESQEALVQEGHSSEGRYTHASQFNYSDEHSTGGSDPQRHRHDLQRKHMQHIHKEHKHNCGSHSTRLTGDKDHSTDVGTPAAHDSTRNLIEADNSTGRELPLLHDILEDGSAYSNLGASSTNPDLGTALDLVHTVGVNGGGAFSIPDRETKI